MLFLGYLVVFGSAALASFTGVYRVRQISDPDTRRGLLALLLASGGWATCHVGFLLTPTSAGKVGFYMAGLIIGFGAVWTWLYFCSAYTGRSLHRNQTLRRLGLLVFGAAVLVKLTNPFHGLYFTTEPVALPFPHLAIDHGVLHWSILSMSYSLAAVGLFMLFELFGQVPSGTKTIGTLVSLTVLPGVFNAVGYTSPQLLNISHEPLGVTAFAVGVLFVYSDQFRDVRLSGQSEEPALVLGRGGQVRSFNDQAAALFPTLEEQTAVGRPMDVVLPRLNEARQGKRSTIALNQNSAPRYFRISETRLGSDDVSGDRLLLLTDVTERERREQALRKEQAALRSLYRITADREASFEEKVQRLIELGRDYLDLSYGFLTRISEGTQRIVHASGDHSLIQPGETCPLSQSFCRKTIQRNGLLAVQNAPDEGWNGDPAYEKFEFGSYVGSKVLTEGELYGTFCFAAPDPRDAPFTERERTFVELATLWTSYELEQKHAQEQLRHKNKRLDSFAGLVSHDLRNPLNVAQVRLGLVRKKSANQEIDDHLEPATRALNRMDEIIQDVLALTRGGQDLNPEDLEFHDLAQVAKASWDHVDTADATLDLENIPAIRASESRLQQILENLFRNAVEHGGTGVTITVGALPDGFFVEDDGPGIPAEERERVFEAGRSSADEGTGLGLSIVKTIAEAHEWSVSVTEGQEGGARFELTGAEVEAQNREADPSPLRS